MRELIIHKFKLREFLYQNKYKFIEHETDYIFIANFAIIGIFLLLLIMYSDDGHRKGFGSIGHYSIRCQISIKWEIHPAAVLI